MDPLNKSGSLFWRIIKSKLFITALAAAIFYTLCGFFLAPYLIKKQLTHYVGKDLGHRVEVQKIRLNPYALLLEVEDFTLSESDGSLLFSFNRLLVNFELKGLFRWAWSFDDVRLDDPVVRLDIDPLGDVNWARLVAAAAPDKEAIQEETEALGPQEGALPRLIIEHIRLTNGRIDFIDRANPTAAEAIFEPLNLTITHLTTLAGEKGSEIITITEPEGGVLEWNGKISLAPIGSEGQIVMRDWKPALVWRFLQDELFLKEPKGTIEASVHYQVSYRNPSFQLALKQLQVKASEISLTMEDSVEPFLSMHEIKLSDGHYDLFSNELTIGQLDIANGHVTMAVDPDGRLRWQRLLEDRPARADTREDPKKEGDEDQPIEPFRLQLNRMALKNIALRYTDHRGSQPFVVDLKRLGLSFSADLEQWAGGLRGRANNLSIDVAGIRLNQLDTGETLLEVPTVGVRDGQIDLTEQAITINDLFLSDGRVALWRNKEGILNWVSLFDTSSADHAQAHASGSETKPWSVALPAIRLKGFRLDVADHGLPSPDLYTLQNINIGLTDYDSAPETAIGVDLEMEVAQGGEIKVKGTFDPGKPSAKASVEVRNFALTPLHPYLAKVSDLMLSSGSYSLNGELQYGTPGPGALRFKGDTQIENLRLDLATTEAPLTAWKALNARGVTLSLAPNGLEIDMLLMDQPDGELIIKEDLTLNIRDAFKPAGKGDPGSGRVKVDKSQPDASLGSEKKSPQNFPVKVKHLQIRDGKLAYADLSLKPRFAADIHNLNGKIVGLSTDPAGIAALELKGRVGQYGSADIKGELQPFNIRSHSDVKLIFHNMELTDFTSYSAKYAGRKIDSGKLSAEIDYQIRKSRLRGENRVVIDSLLLGDRIEDSSAPNLPLDLALALLKDPDGRIDLDLPVSGDLDHPEFSYGHLIWKAIVNVVEKVVTAPFRAIGNLLGIKHEELDQIVFAAGSAEIPPPESEKLAALAKGLLQRPQLGLKVLGRYQPESDGDALKTLAVKREIAAGLGYSLAPGEDPGPLDYTDTVTQAILENMATERRGSEKVTSLKEKYGISSQRSASTGRSEANKEIQIPAGAAEFDLNGFYHELFSLIVEKEPIGKEALVALARQRSEAIIGEMVSVDGVDHARFTVLDPSTTKKIKIDTVSSRLELTAQK